MIYAMFTLVVLTSGVAIHLLRLRIAAVKKGEVSLGYFRLNKGDTAIPRNMEQAANNFSNLFEVPTLFYAAGILSLVLHFETLALSLLAWLFVASRAIHSWIHLTSNNVIRRMQVFLVGNLCLLLMWALIVWQYTLTPMR